jgi:hypothetical protein
MIIDLEKSYTNYTDLYYGVMHPVARIIKVCE